MSSFVSLGKDNVFDKRSIWLLTLLFTSLRYFAYLFISFSYFLTSLLLTSSVTTAHHPSAPSTCLLWA